MVLHVVQSMQSTPERYSMQCMSEYNYLANRLEIAGKATPSPAPMMPLDTSKGTSIRPISAAVGVKTVKRDQSTTPAPRTTFDEYLVATYPPALTPWM